jgi:DNA-binding transcriptional ArsR family regulator
MYSEFAYGGKVEARSAPYFDEHLLKVLSSNTRLEILKHLSESQMTLTDLSRVLDFCKSTVFEHLKKLYDAGLVHRITGRKWIYYRLSKHGHRILRLMAS